MRLHLAVCQEAAKETIWTVWLSCWQSNNPAFNAQLFLRFWEKKNKDQSVNLNGILSYGSTSRIWWLPAPIHTFTGREMDLGISSEKHLTRWKARGPSQKKRLPWHGMCWPQARPYLNTGTKCQVSLGGDEKGLLRLPVWAGSQPCWANCTICFYYSCFHDFALFPRLGCVASVRGTYPWNSPSIRCTVLYWNGHLPNKTPGSFTGSLNTRLSFKTCRLPLRTTSPLWATRTFKAWSHLTLEVTWCQGMLRCSAEGNSPSEQELWHSTWVRARGDYHRNLHHKCCPQSWNDCPQLVMDCH